VNPDEILDDLRVRLQKAEVNLLDLAVQRESDGQFYAAKRLHGKREGVLLALSYIHDYNRQEEP